MVYVPVLQRAFGTVALSADDWLLCALVASSVLWLREASKLAGRLSARARRSGPPVRAADGLETR